MHKQALTIRNLTPGLVEAGKIKIGRKGATKRSQAGKEFQMPEKLDHFLITTLERGADNNYLSNVEAEKMFGKEPTRIPVILVYDSIEANFQSRYACFKTATSGLVRWCTGDGESALRVTEDGKSHEEVACPCPRQDPTYAGRDKCKMAGCLSCMIDGIGGVGGVYKFRTTGYNSVVGITSSLHLIRTLTGGRLAGVPLDMVLSPKSTTSPTDGRQVTVYVVRLEYKGTPQELREIGYQQAELQIRHKVDMTMIEEKYLQSMKIDDAVIGDTVEFTEEFHPPEEETAQIAAPAKEKATPKKAAPVVEEDVPLPPADVEPEPEPEHEPEAEPEPDDTEVAPPLVPPSGGFADDLFE